MIIYIKDLKEGEVSSFEHSYEASALDIEFDDFIFKDSIILKGTLELGADSLRVNGALTGKVHQSCGRCLKVDINPFEKKIDLFFDIHDITEIDITQELRETLILDHPIAYRCHEGESGKSKTCIEGMGETNNDSDWGESKEKPFSSLEKIFDRLNKEKKNGSS